ncbi:hypothetical protein [Halalkalirubrum salinum]|uniref:hypothetical protein n=1 Tax=Halalkalirubrum salinum TaxID=2563889 RepID=UPI0010FB4AD5|nr:hypothetical protein [Halalkalirubrum salinum]
MVFDEESTDEPDRADTGDNPTEPARQREGPLSDLADRVESRRTDRETGLFESVDVPSVDGEKVLNEVIETPIEPDHGPESVDKGLSESATADEDILDKRTYCQRCPYLSEPPNLSCEHEGTEIVTVVDIDHFRVRGCPMVTEVGPQFNHEQK